MDVFEGSYRGRIHFFEILGQVILLGTTLGIFALTLAILTTALWFYLPRQVAFPDDRSGFVFAWMCSSLL